MITVTTIAIAIVELNAEPSYGINIDFNYVMQLYSRGVRVVNKAHPRYILDISYTSGSRFLGL